VVRATVPKILLDDVFTVRSACPLVLPSAAVQRYLAHARALHALT
jgi:hypothetical protein